MQHAIYKDAGRHHVIGIDLAKLAQVLCLHDGQSCRHRDYWIEIAT